MVSQNCHLNYMNSFKLLLQNFIFLNAAISEVLSGQQRYTELN